MTTTGRWSRRPRGWRTAGIVAGALAAVVVALAVGTMQWAQALLGEQRLLPGTTVAGVEVGGLSVDEASRAAGGAVEAALDRTVTVTFGDEEWRTTPRDLGAGPPTRAALQTALTSALAPSWTEVARSTWFRAERAVVRDVAVTVPDDDATAFVAALAEEVDRATLDARIEWSAAGGEVVAHRTGREVRRDVAVQMLHEALAEGSAAVELPVTVRRPVVTTDAAERVLPEVRAAVDVTLDRSLTLRHDDEEWTVSHREIGAQPDVGAVTAAAVGRLGWHGTARPTPSEGGATPAGYAGDATFEPDVPLRLPRSAAIAIVADVAAEIDLPARDAALDYSSGRIEIVEEQDGRAVERALAVDELQDAVSRGADVLDLPVSDVAPEVTTEAYRKVLLVRQDERRLYLYVDGDVQREWRVAIGSGGSPTPTGEFTVGAKRHGPTWYNPAPNGWGANMPRVIGPGPNNPLGLRALNWDRDGYDTLIRFHGTADLGSIGRAASRGCVRLTNADVIELFDAVPSGTPIVSLWG